MITAKFLEGKLPNAKELAEQLGQLFSEGPTKTQDELRRGIEHLLHKALTQLDVVTREEFDAQQAVLQRTRELVVALEQRLDALEASQSANVSEKKVAASADKTEDSASESNV